MRKSSYDTWAIRIDAAIRSRAHAPDGVPRSAAARSVQELLLAFAAESGAVVGAIARNVEAVQIVGNDRLAAIENILDELLPHESFSLLEYRYTLPMGEQPGLRFHVDLASEPERIEVHQFEDTRRWRTDRSSRSDYEEPISFELRDGTWCALPHADYEGVFANCTDWQSAVRETLTLPFRHLYDRAVRAS